MTGPLPDVWLRGPVPDVHGLLQPVAHALLQAAEDVTRVVSPLETDFLWKRWGEAASVGFHVRHATGSLDRLFTYARGESLSPAQQAALAAEKHSPAEPAPTAGEVVSVFVAAVDRAVAQLRTTSESGLLAARHVGRDRLPSTVLGLLVHAAEHTQRHVGQIITTARISRSL